VGEKQLLVQRLKNCKEKKANQLTLVMLAVTFKCVP